MENMIELVKSKLEEYGMSMRELSRRVNIDVSYISKLIKSNTNPSIKIAFRLAKELNIDPVFINRIYQIESNFVEEFESEQFNSREKAIINMFIKEIDNLKNDTNDGIDSIVNIVNQVAKLRKHYYIITTEENEIYIYETPSIDKRVLRLYSMALDINPSFVVKQIISAPGNATVYDIYDVLEKLKENQDDENCQDLIAILEKSI